MEVRDAVEGDAEGLARLADVPADVLRNVIHDRTVRVAVAEDAEEILGFVSFDASPETVYVTQLQGSPETCRQLLGEPIRFAQAEDMDVEVLISVDDEELRRAADDAGFDRIGPGPRFEGTGTVRYRRETA